MHVQCPLQIQFSSVALLTFAMECNFKHGLTFNNTDFTSLTPTDINFVIIRDEKKMAKFANSVGLDEVAQDEPPHQDLHCLPSSL